jgi:hypothetical protein
MAYVKIEGIVDYEIGNDIKGILGFRVKETVTNSSTGQSWDVTWTIWSKTAPPVGSMVEVRGELGVKAREYTKADGSTAQTIDRNINAPEVKVLRAAPASAGVQERPNWDESPF